MTPTTERINNKEQIEYLGMDSENFKRIIIPIELQNTLLDNAIDSNSLTKKLEYELINNISPLDKCLECCNISYEDNCFSVLLSENKPDITVAVLHDILMMKLFPPKNVIVNDINVDLPIFEIEYSLINIPFNTQENSIIHSIIKSINEFEGEFLFELLNKAVRSQRNKIEKSLDINSINKAMELIERENESVENILTNTKAYSIVKDNTNNINIVNFSPKGRMNKNRVYFLTNPSILGKVIKTNYTVNIKKLGDNMNISCLLRIGAVILNRDVISVIEH